ncbi:polysaccharide biosynthesis/export family protein [Bizionia paragorgiae]|uniref:Polysaccharide export outer membrane protein n=1 Tax=Bizionia paragorgiae TaxID=283786 RepID=A0A1H4D8N0_BIZPA|nr:polysaccharide biosynthesis/export family protein [Bizionia paragorgiae]SEA68928.1 polysaccharide export outer membrane protein [Bizionia paragorgiae]
MIKQHLSSLLSLVVLAMLLSSCVSNKEILYFQDADSYKETNIEYRENTVQPNDILSITISAAIPETAIPYNRTTNTNFGTNLEILKLQGYLVNAEGFVAIPVLGKVEAREKTTSQLEVLIAEQLETGGHLVDPIVSVRLLNAKVTVLGEVVRSGTFTFTEQNISVPQALGYAGDLTINGRRDDILLIRELDGVRSISHIDLTTANWMENPEYMIRPNDVLVVQPNRAKVKTAGYVGNVTTIVSIASLLLSATILLTR